MKGLSALIQAKMRLLRNHLRFIRRHSTLKVATVALFTLAFWVGGLCLFYRGFAFLYSFPSLGALLSERVLALFFLTLFVMLTLSNILVSYSTLYRSKEVEFLLSQPLTVEVVFTGRFGEGLLFSSWAFLFMGTPLMLAFGLVSKSHWPFYPALALGFLPFILLTGSLGTSFTLILVRLFPFLTLRGLVILLLSIFLPIGIFLYRSFAFPNLYEMNFIEQILDALKVAQKPFLPSHWINQSLWSFAQGDIKEGLFYLGVLWSNGLFFTLVVFGLASSLFYRGWVDLRGKRASQRNSLGIDIIGSLEPFLRWFSLPYRVFMLKDMRMFWRDTTQWLQFVLLFGLMTVYVANLRNMPAQMDSPFWRNTISFLNLGSTSLLLAVLTTRFIFPLFSLEGRRFWLVGLAPISWRGLLMQKYLLSLLCTSFFSMGIMLLSALILRVSSTVMVVCLLTMAMMNLSLNSLAVSLGALFPNFKEDNPARIVSGLGGTLNFLFSILYVALVVISEGFCFHVHKVEGIAPLSFPLHLFLTMTGVALLSLLMGGAPMALALRQLKRMEF